MKVIVIENGSFFPEHIRGFYKELEIIVDWELDLFMVGTYNNF